VSRFICNKRKTCENVLCRHYVRHGLTHEVGCDGGDEDFECYTRSIPVHCVPARKKNKEAKP